MLAYQIKPDGLGYSADDKFFWSEVSAGKFCQHQLADHLRASVKLYTQRAEIIGGFYLTIRKYNALANLNQFISNCGRMLLPELANQVLALEPDMRAIVPGKQNPNRNSALQQINDLTWLCVRIRKQLKASVNHG